MLVNENLLAFEKYLQENVKRNRTVDKTDRELCSHISCRYRKKDSYLQLLMIQSGYDRTSHTISSQLRVITVYNWSRRRNNRN